MRDKNNPKPGNLDGDDYILIARCLLSVVRENNLVFDAIAGIPRAGDPIVDAIEKMMEYDPVMQQGDFRIIKLAKEEGGGIRKIVPLPGFKYKEGERILLFDDLVTKADTKLEAISAIESSGSIVEALIVLVDRQQGGMEQVRSAGYKIFAALTIAELLDYYVQEKLVDEDKYQEAINYVRNV